MGVFPSGLFYHELHEWIEGFFATNYTNFFLLILNEIRVIRVSNSCNS